MNTDLLRPPAHRGPLIAAGAVVLAVGVVLEELRLGDKLPIGVHVLITARDRGRDPRDRVAGAERGRPPAARTSRCCS